MAICQEEIIQIKRNVKSYYESLIPVQKKMGMLHFAGTARVQWNNLPAGLRARAGISMGSLSDEQRMLIHRILSASLSSQGYLKATALCIWITSSIFIMIRYLKERPLTKKRINSLKI